jgi:hypothetical protein
VRGCTLQSLPGVCVRGPESGRWRFECTFIPVDPRQGSGTLRSHTVHDDGRGALEWYPLLISPSSTTAVLLGALAALSLSRSMDVAPRVKRPQWLLEGWCPVHSTLLWVGVDWGGVFKSEG